MADAAGKSGTPYAGYDVLRKWTSPSFDATTRAVLERRLMAVPPRRFLAEAPFRALEAASARLLATPPGQPPIANWIDADLLANRGEGFRHPGVPRLQEAWRQGLAGLDAEAQRRFGTALPDLGAAEQDATLRAVQAGDVAAESFQGTPARHFFTHLLLKTVVGYFYSHPDAWNEIGFGGPASPRGYVRIGLSQRDPWEAPLAQEPRR